MDDIREVLKKSGYRVTTGRVRLLNILKEAGKPLSIRDILKRAKGDLLDQVTLYRALESLSKRGVIERVDLNSGVAHYEYAPHKKHHHHLVCTSCGEVEDVKNCGVSQLEERVVKGSRRFKSIYSHNLEFFGNCNRCSQ